MPDYSLLLTGGRVIDPLNGVDQIADVALDGGRVAEVGAGLPRAGARQVVDVAGRVVTPGIVDPHAHMSGDFGGTVAYRMMARVGVTTALEMAGLPEATAEGLATMGCGMQAACLLPVIPGRTVSGPNPDQVELRRVIEGAVERGALGVKLLGGHYPLTPEASAAVIEIAAEIGCHVASHAGTTATGSDIRGVREIAELAGGQRLHLAHVNSYCRGVVIPDPIEEVQVALDVLARHPNLVSEAYMARINGTSAVCRDGVPASNVTKTCLRTGGYEPTEAGLAAAIRAGWGQIQATAGGESVLLTGEDGVRLWRERGTDCGLSFAVNPPTTGLLLAVAKHAGGRFAVDALSTDGGSIPRNTIVAQGLPLVRWGALTIEEFVRKASLNSARLLGLPGKGHLSPGADADVTVLDLDRLTATLAVSAGQVIMVDGVVVGSGGTLLATRRHRQDFAGVTTRVVPMIGEQHGEAILARTAA